MNKKLTLNMHLTNDCNYSCLFCFSKDFTNSKTTICCKQYFKVLEKLKAHGQISRINFVGGEPLVFPWIDELILYAHKLGLETSIVTNASLLTTDWIRTMPLSMIGISIDSWEEEICKKIGRVSKDKVLTYQDISKLIEVCKERHISVKINTVVSQLNKNEYLFDSIQALGVDKWKIFQVLPMENKDKTKDLVVSDDEFKTYCNRNEVDSKDWIWVENNDTMIHSYLMLDPQLRFVNNSDNVYKYSSSILDVDIDKALSEVNPVSLRKYEKRSKTRCNKNTKSIILI